MGCPPHLPLRTPPAHSPLLRTLLTTLPPSPGLLGQESEAQLVTHSGLCSLIYQPLPVLGEDGQASGRSAKKAGNPLGPSLIFWTEVPSAF